MLVISAKLDLSLVFSDFIYAMSNHIAVIVNFLISAMSNLISVIVKILVSAMSYLISAIVDLLDTISDSMSDMLLPFSYVDFVRIIFNKLFATCCSISGISATLSTSDNLSSAA
jgi:phage-related protein